MTQAETTIGLVAVPRDAPSSPGQDDRARYLPRLRQPLQQLEPLVGGRPLRQLLAAAPSAVAGTCFLDDQLSVVDLAWPGEAASALRQLAGVQPRDDVSWPLGDGRLPLYVCCMCGDLGCGALTAAVARTPEGERVVWHDFRVENGYPDQEEMTELSAVGPFVFDAEEYQRVLLEPVAALDALAADEEAARAEHRRTHGLRGAVGRLVRRGTGA